jgi:poly(hydroxyalkanoate) depolymerase family esterase
MYDYVPDHVAPNPGILVLPPYWAGTAGAAFAEASNSGLVAAADRYGFIIVVPQTSDPDGTGRGWDANSAQSLLHDGGGDTQGIAEMVQYTINTYHADADRVYVTGVSSGAIMTEVLLATYPDVFKGGVEFGGVPAGAWAAGNPDPNGWSELAAAGQVTHTPPEWGDIARAMYPGYSGHRPRVELWHGTADHTISYTNQTEAIKQWTNVLGLSTDPTSTDTVTIGNQPYTHQVWQDSSGNTVLDAWSEIGGPHGTDALFDASYVIPFMGLDRVEPGALSSARDSDIGSPSPAGSSSYDGDTGTWTVAGGGADIGGTSDQFHYLSQSFTGDGPIVARVTSLQNTNDSAKAGVMFRDSADAGAMYADVAVTAGQGVSFQWRSSTGGSSADTQVTGVTAPAWVKLVRSGNSFSAFYATTTGTPTASDWIQVGTAQTIAMSSTAQVGLAVTSHNDGTPCTSTFRGVQLGSLGTFNTSLDIGSPSQAGWSSYDADTHTWTVAGGGADIWGTSDQFHYLSMSLTGDDSMGARVTSVQNTDDSAKAGVMFRDSAAADAAYAFAWVSPSNQVEFDTRSANGASASSSASISAGGSPVWVRLLRSGARFSAYYSLDGVTWTQVGTTWTVVMNPTALAGLAVTAHDDSALCAATFTNVSVLPTGWSEADIGGPGRPGYAASNPNAGTWAVGGGGGDIGGTSDQFHFVSQGFTGDGSLTARVSSLENTDPGAKAGVMFRDSSDPSAVFADVLATPGNGVTFQWRDTYGALPQFVNVTGLQAPVWVQLVRAGNAFGGYYSTDGVIWNQLGAPQTLVMNATALVGLAVTAHDDSALCAASLDNLSVVTQVDLSGAFNQVGAVADGATFAGGLDGNGNAYSASWLGSRVAANGFTFNLGGAGGLNAVQGLGQTISLPAGQFSTLTFLGTGVNGPQPGQTFVVNYTDGTSDTFTQDLSDWQHPRGYAGESVVVATGYSNSADGSSPEVPSYLYQYSFTLNKHKTISSITLPGNGNVMVLAMNLLL